MAGYWFPHIPKDSHDCLSMEQEDGTDHTRTILVAVAGGSPAIVTETLWALARQRGEPVNEVRVITTRKGEILIKSALLDPAANKSNPSVSRFAECCYECGMNPKLVPFSIHTLKKELRLPLLDIRNDLENQLAADQICNLIREWTSERNTKLYCSAAGGRKTMSIYLTIAMMLYGRAEDRLYHVLVNPEEFELCKEFFHPYRIPRELPLYDRTGGLIKNISTADVRIDLAEIPFVRLSVLDTPQVFDTGKRYSEVVNSVQHKLEFLTRAGSSHVQISRPALGSTQVPIEVAGKTCHLSGAPGFIYTLVADDRKRREAEAGIEVDLITIKDLHHVYRLLTASDLSEAMVAGTEYDFVVEWIKLLRMKDPEARFKNAIQVNVHRANESLQEVGFPARFWIENLNLGKRGKQSQGAMYIINLPGDAIHLPSL